MGSVKDLNILKRPEPDAAGIGQFVFSDRYSVFDWGEMPDLIEHKGKALCLIGAYFFEQLEQLGVQSHYLGLVENNKARRLAQVKQPSDTMQVKLLRVIKPEVSDHGYDYLVYQKERTNFLIPLEVIYRNTLPPGSSVFRRLKEGSLKLADIGLDEMPSPSQKLKDPILDVSTKLEITDRYLSWEEAQQIAGMSESEINKLKEILVTINTLITAEVEKLQLINEDGKVEFGYDENRIPMLVDVLGTPDECRFTFNEIPVSKEIARIFYRKTEWYQEIERAKQQDRLGWKNLVSQPPPHLPDRLKTLISQLYQAFANEITNRNWFNTPSLQKILLDISQILELSIIK